MGIAILDRNLMMVALASDCKPKSKKPKYALNLIFS